MASALKSFGEALYTGKGIRPEGEQSIVRPEWLASAATSKPLVTPDNPTVRSERPPPIEQRIDDTTKDLRDWDIVTPPGSPTHLHELCGIANISVRKEVERYPILPPSEEPVVPFRALGEQVCNARLQQFEDMEQQRLGGPPSGVDYLSELQEACDWNVVERIVYDQRMWEREEMRRQKELRHSLKHRADGEGGARKVQRSNELVLLEVVEDFDMDVGQDGVIMSCELECHITAETHLQQQRTLSMWLEKLFLLEECKLHPRIEQQAFRSEQVLRFVPDTDHVIELCNFKVLRSVMSCIVPPLVVKPHFMFEGAVCRIHVTATVLEGHGENIDIVFPMPEAMVSAPSLTTSGDASTAVFGSTTKLCRWQIPRLDKFATLEGSVALQPAAPVPAEGPLLKAKFEVVGLNVSGVSVAAVEADSELQPRLVLRHVVRSVDSTVESTVGRFRQDTADVGTGASRPLFAL